MRGSAGRAISGLRSTVAGDPVGVGALQMTLEKAQKPRERLDVGFGREGVCVPKCVLCVE